MRRCWTFHNEDKPYVSRAQSYIDISSDEGCDISYKSNGEISIKGDSNITIRGWPFINITINGDPYEQATSAE